MGSAYYRFFFVIFYIVGVILTLNLLIAFIIEWTISMWDSNINKIEEK